MVRRLLFFAVLALSAFAVRAQMQEGEANLKAAFIYNFINYIDWEPANDSGDFVIGVIGASDITQSLEEFSRGKTAKNRKVVVRVYTRPEEIGACQILFIPRNLPFSLRSILDKIHRGVLTISEEEGYGEQGTALNFYIKNDKLKFEANLKAIDGAGLKAGAELLKLARIVGQ